MTAAGNPIFLPSTKLIRNMVAETKRRPIKRLTAARHRVIKTSTSSPRMYRPSKQNGTSLMKDSGALITKNPARKRIIPEPVEAYDLLFGWTKVFGTISGKAAPARDGRNRAGRHEGEDFTRRLCRRESGRASFYCRPGKASLSPSVRPSNSCTNRSRSRRSLEFGGR